MAADLASALAARQTEEKVRRAVLAAYDFTDTMRDRVPCKEVFAVAAQVLATHPQSPGLIRMVKSIVSKAGGILVRPKGARAFACMRNRARELIPGEGMPHTPRDPSGISALRRAWWARMKAEGLDMEEGTGGRMKELPKYREYRAEINAAFFQKAAEHYWRWRRELDIWGYYALEGLSVREIAAKLNLARTTVGDVVAQMRRELEGGGHLTEDKETGDDVDTRRRAESDEDDTGGA